MVGNTPSGSCFLAAMLEEERCLLVSLRVGVSLCKENRVLECKERALGKSQDTT